MSDKHLPIQFFEKRKGFDDRSTEGGGDSKPPAWVLSGEALTQRSVELKVELNEIYTAFDAAVARKRNPDEYTYEFGKKDIEEMKKRFEKKHAK